MIALRPVRAGDREFLARLYATTREDEMRLVDWDDGQKQAFLTAQFEAQDRYYAENYRNASFDVVEIDGDPGGRLYVDRRDSEIRIVDISLLPEHRGKGHGASLLEALIEEGQRTNRRVTIHVERFNRARALYERLGFQVTGDRGVYLFMEHTT